MKYRILVSNPDKQIEICGCHFKRAYLPAVFTSKKKAQEFAEACNKANPNYYHEVIAEGR